METTKIKAEDLKAGFVNFQSKNWGFAGDKGTWARVDKKDNRIIIIINKAMRGMISEAYTNEISDFCENFDVNFNDISSGQKITITI